MTVVRHLIESDFAVNARLYDAVGDGVTDDTAALVDAYNAAAASSGQPGLWLPMGLYVFDAVELDFLTDDMVIATDGAGILFKNGAVWQIGSVAHTTARNRFYGVRFKVDASSTVVAPLHLLKQSGTGFDRCIFDQIKDAGILSNYGEFRLRNCDSRMMPGAGNSVVKADISTGDRASVFIQGGRFATGGTTAQWLVDFSGAGQLDGCVLMGVNTSDLSGALKARPSVGGKLSNCMAFGCLFDAVDPCAFDLAMPAGSVLSDVSIIGNKINGDVSSTATSSALISIDLTSGATMDDKGITITENVLNGTRVRAFECLGGTLTSLVFSRNTFLDYGRQVNVASRAAYIAGTFDYLEVADNHGRTANTHDFDIEFGAVTATKRKVQGNTFAGTAANTSQFNSYAHHSGEFGQIDFSVAATVLTQNLTTIKGAAAGRTSAGIFTLTYPSATPYLGAQASATADGCYCSITRTSSTVFTLKCYGEGGTTLTDPAAVSFGLRRAA